MINLAWSGEVSQSWLTMTHLKTARSIMIHENNIGDMTEESLQASFDDNLSDKEVMLAFKVLFECVRNK
jgi:hypothetical protein